MTNDDIAPLPLFSACLPDLRKAYRVDDALEITKRAVHPLADDSTASDDEDWVSSAARNSTYCKHERALEVAAMAGEVQLLSHLDYMPLQFPTGDAFLNALIARDELQRFARMKLRIELTMPAVAATALAPAAEKPVPGVVADDAPPLEDWKMRVQAEAATHWRYLRTLGCNPTKHGMLNHLAKWCKANDVFLPGGSNPSEGSIKNRALVKWNPPR